MGSTSLWTSAPPAAGAVESSARRISTGNARRRWKLREGAITRVPCSRLRSTAATILNVDRQIIRDFSRPGAQMRTVILRMIPQAHLHALVEPTIGLCSAPQALPTIFFLWRCMEVIVRSKGSSKSEWNKACVWALLNYLSTTRFSSIMLQFYGLAAFFSSVAFMISMRWKVKRQ